MNTSLSAHQILWEVGLMFLASKTHFLSYWAKEKVLIVQTRTCADFLHAVIAQFPRDPSRSNELDGDEGEVWEGEKGISVACSSSVWRCDAQLQQPWVTYKVWVHKSVSQNSRARPGALARGMVYTCHRVKPCYELGIFTTEAGQSKSGSVNLMSPRALCILIANMLSKFARDFPYILVY